MTDVDVTELTSPNSLSDQPREVPPVPLSPGETARQKVDDWMQQAESYRSVSLSVARFIHRLLTRQGEEVREIADILHGKPLGHALHPVLTDVTVGSWSIALIFDLLSMLPGSGDYADAADKLTALTGMVDFSAIKQNAAGHGSAHALLNSVGLLCYVRSFAARLAGNRVAAIFYSLIGMGVMTVSAWLGGELVYGHKIGVNHVPAGSIPDWTPVMPLVDLLEGQPTRREVNGVPVLLFMRGADVFAINAVCSHAGGPLDQGRVVNEVCIECPWHQSVFDLRDGHVVHSPATYSQPRYEIRVLREQIEVRSVPVEPG